jgi:transposase
MTKTSPIALDYENTLVLAIELSSTSWVLAAQVPGLPQVKAKQTIEARTEALLAAIDGYRAGRRVERMVAIYEAGWSGFWLARWLFRQGVETHVVQPSSVPVDRRAAREIGWDRRRSAVAHAAGLVSGRAAGVLDGTNPRRSR